MARRPKQSSQPGLDRETLAADVQAFLASGQKIQKIPAGVTGQVALAGKRHIVIGKSQAARQQ